MAVRGLALIHSCRTATAAQACLYIEFISLLSMAPVADTRDDTGGTPYGYDSSVTSGATGSTSMHFCSMCSRGHVNRAPCWNCKQQFRREYELPYDLTADTQPSLRPPPNRTGTYVNEIVTDRWLQ